MIRCILNQGASFCSLFAMRILFRTHALDNMILSIKRCLVYTARVFTYRKLFDLNNNNKMYNISSIITRRYDIRPVVYAKLSSTAGSWVGREQVKKTKSYEEIPGPKSYPVIGTLYKYLPLLGDYSANALDKNAWLNWRRYGDLVRESPGVRLVHVFDPDDIEAVFRQDDRYPARRSHVAMRHYRLSKPDVYKTGGLLSTNGPEWWRLRSAFQKNFTSPQSVKGHIEDTDHIVKEFVQYVKTTKVTSNDDFLIYLNRLNLEVIGKVAFDERFNSFSADEEDSSSRSSKIIAAAFRSNSGIMKLDKGFLWTLFKTPLYWKLARSQEYLETVARELLRRKTYFFKRPRNPADHSLLTSFLEVDNVTLKDILGMIVDILMAAIDTTAYSTSFALYHLATNPECQEKLFQEALTILPNKDSPLTAETLSKAHYARRCIKESLRLNPVSIGVGRLLQKDIVLKGYHIPKDTVIVTQNMVASRLPQNVRDPLKFRPDRWARDSPHYESLHPFLSLPFGFGPRSCIARRLAEQNMCITLIRMIREFEIVWAGKELGIKTLLINKPNLPITMDFNVRSL